jgi:hypothetical protein
MGCRPVKLILSRKGFDTTSGGGPSPILPDGRMLSLPIPEPVRERADDTGGTTYGDLLDLDGTSYLEILHALGYTGFTPSSRAHLDPDLVRSARRRGRRWRGMLGQADAAASHLRNQGVGPGDLFLFWGLYAHAHATRPLRAQPFHHAVFGYLEVDRVVDLGAGGTLVGAPYHPHLSPAYRGRTNLVYVATERLSHDPALPGWGVLRWSPSLTLTAPGSTGLLTWELPACFHPSTGTELTYHRSAAWTPADPRGRVRVTRRGRGQEFVCDATPEIRRWALGLIGQPGRQAPAPTGRTPAP